MATKNKNLIYDIDELKVAFNNYLSDTLTAAKTDEKIEAIEERITSLTIKLSSINADIEEMKDLTVDIDEVNALVEEYDEYIDVIKKLAACVSRYNVLEEKKATSGLTDEEKTEMSRIVRENNALYEKYNEKLTKLKEELKPTSFEDFTNKLNEIAEHFKNLISQAQKREKLKADKISVEYAITELNDKKEELEKNKIKLGENSAENFKKFLESEGLPTVHAEEIFEYLNDHSKALKIEKNAFQIRKRHPKRDAFIKKGLIPGTVTGAGIGGTVGLIASSGLVGGSTVLGFIPVSGTPGLTALATTITGGAVGLVATPAIILTKNASVKLYYKSRYRSAKSNLKDYQTGTELENLKITDLIEKVENTKHSILKLGQGKWYEKTLKFMPKHILNTINRNRIHHIEKYTKDLMSIYATIENGDLDASKKAAELKPIYELLTQVENFVAKDVAESKLHAMLTCKENKKHSHKSTIENIDIFANLKIYLDTVGLTTDKEEKVAQEKQAKKTTKNLKQKNATAAQILNGERLIPKMINYEVNYAKFNSLSKNEFVVVNTSSEDSDSKRIIKFDSGKSITVNTTDIKPDVDIEKVKIGKSKTIITYVDGSTSEILKPVKITPEIETARRVMYTKITEDKDFIDKLKETYDIRTINTLATKLQEWINNPTKKIALSGKSKELYVEVMEIINRENEVSAIV